MRIAFGFKAGAGKDHAAEYLRGKYGGYNLKFAAPVKQLAEMIQREMGFPIEKDRKLLQWLATDYGRAKDPDVWVRQMRLMIKEAVPAHMFVSDMRFLNEAEMLKEEGFLLVCIQKKETLAPEIAKVTNSWKRHVSETELENFGGWDYIINNCGTIEHFEGQLDVLWQLAKDDEHLINKQATVIV